MRWLGMPKGEVDAVRDEIEMSRRSVEAVETQAKTATAQVAISQSAIAAGVRPILVNVPNSWRQFNEQPPPPQADVRTQMSWFTRWQISVTQDSEDEQRLAVRLPVRNIGAGTAFINQATFSGLILQGRDASFIGGVANAIVPPKEAAWLRFSLPGRTEIEQTSEALRHHGLFTVRINYTDLGGNEWESRLIVKPTSIADDEGWYVAETLVKAGKAPDEEAVRSGQMEPS
jgi:hypothetical protein